MIPVLHTGALGIFPTDTVYGLVAHIENDDAVAALYALKGRSRSQPCQVLTYDAAALDVFLASLPPVVASVARALLPGSVTCIVPDNERRFASVAGSEGSSVGLRAPLMSAPLTDIPGWFAATSANEPGGRDPDEVARVPERIRRACDVVLDIGRLPGTASAVVDLRPTLTGDPPTVLRPGADPTALELRLRAITPTAGAKRA